MAKLLRDGGYSYHQSKHLIAEARRWVARTAEASPLRFICLLHPDDTAGNVVFGSVTIGRWSLDFGHPEHLCGLIQFSEREPASLRFRSVAA